MAHPNHHHAQYTVTDASAVPTFSQYPTDQKPHPTSPGDCPAEAEQFSNSILPEDAQYLRKYAAANAAAPPSGPSPPAPRRKLQPQASTEAVNIVPDENPLTPTFVSPIQKQNTFPNLDSMADTHLPGQAQHANQSMKGGTWKYGLCDCGDIGVCCTGIWCPCVLYGRTQYRLAQRSRRKDPTNLLGFSAFNGACASFAILCGCNFILAGIQHSRVRKAYRIPGGVGTDFLKACCCCCCTLSQDEKEIKFRETEARKSAGLTMQYASPGGMSFSPPPQ